MKKDVKKALLKYGGVAASVLGVSQANAQYQYTDIPDTTIDFNNGYYNLDLDQDGNPDYTITQYVDTGVSGNIDAVIIQPYTNTINRVAGERMGSFNYPFNQELGSTVDGSTDWEGCGGQFTTGYMAFVNGGTSYPNSNWIGPVNDGFLGLELRVNGIPYYGWARIDVGVDSKSFTVKDFSYNTEIDSAAVIGFELLGDVENMLEKVTIAVTADEIIVSQLANSEVLAATLYDVNGRLLLEEQSTEQELILSTAQLPKGVYVLELKQNALVRREKLLIY